MNPPTDLKFIFDPEIGRTFRQKLKEQRLRMGTKYTTRRLLSPTKLEFENRAVMANPEKIFANAIYLTIRVYAHPVVEELNPWIISL